MAKYKYYQDTGFVVGDSPVTHDVTTDLGRPANGGYIKNTGSGSLTFAIKNDVDDAFGDEVTLGAGEIHNFAVNENQGLDRTGFNISALRITHVTDTTYKIYLD